MRRLPTPLTMQPRAGGASRPNCLNMCIALCAVVAACSAPSPTPPARNLSTKPLIAATAIPNPCAVYGVQNVVLQPILPTQFSPSSNQLGADCMAWQTFIALAWAADPNQPGSPDPNALPSSFGTPGTGTPKVWESYFEASTVFNPPTPGLLRWNAARPSIKQLSRTSKQGATDLSLSNIGQAGDGKWLTSQRGGLAFYEVLINQDEFEFITTNVFSGADLTTFAGQAACASQPGQKQKGGFVLPAGGGNNAQAQLDTDCLGNPKIYGKNVGSIEVKAAWTALPADHSLDYRYQTAVAQITAPDGSTSSATVGLVGLHIIHKVPGAPQFVWATFEQIDNSPDDAGTGYQAPALPPNPNQQARPGYTFFNPQCTVATDPTYQCQHNRLPGTPCNAQGQPAGCDAYSAPMQITRLVPTDNTANQVTGYAWSLLPANSVYNYYRLINVQWPSSPATVPPQSLTPLPTGDITPSPNSGIVANTTLESFQQSKNACMSCHQFASIAVPSNQTQALVAGHTERKVRPRQLTGAGAPYASDYSFLFVSETVR